MLAVFFMPLTKEQKKNKIKEIKEKIDRQKSVVFVSVDGLKANDALDLRRRLKKEDAEMSVVKKTLAKIVFDEKKIEIEKGDLKGEVAFVFGFKDEVSSAKTVYQFSKENKKLQIVGGLLENIFIEDDKVVSLAKIPSKEVLYSKVVGTAAAPISNFLSVLEGNIKGLVQVLSLIKK